MSSTPAAALDREGLVRRFDTALDRLEAALRDCPEEHWHDSVWHVPRTDPWVWPQRGVEPVPERTDETIQRFSAFWCVAYHCLWFLDYYLTMGDERFESPEYVQGGPEELGFAADGAVAVPGETWPREALLRHLEHGRRKVHDVVPTVDDAVLARRCPDHHPHAGETFGQVLLVNLAHVEEHGAQLAAFVDEIRTTGGPAGS